MRSALAEAFAGLGLAGQDSWRYAARVRLLLGGRIAIEELRADGAWADGDLRWLAGVNTVEDKTYVNKESFEELLVWLQIPALLGIAGRLGGDEAYGTAAAELAELEGTLRAECERMEEAGYDLRAYLGEYMEREPQEVDNEVIAR